MSYGDLENMAKRFGYSDAMEMLVEVGDDSVVPGLCRWANCDGMDEVECDCTDGVCPSCGEGSIQSCLIMAGMI